MKKCLYCAEEIQEEAIKCKHCGEWLEKDVKNPSSEVVEVKKVYPLETEPQVADISPEKDEEIKVKKKAGLKQCPTCGKWDVYRAYTEDGSTGYWCPHCKKSIKEVMIETSKYVNIEKILTEADGLLQQIGPEIIEQSHILKKLKFERGRLATAATQWQAGPDKKEDLLLPEGKQLPETREVLQAPGLDLSPAEQASVQASIARARRGTLILWGLVALLMVSTLLAGYQWQRAKVAERSAQAAEKARNLAHRDLSVSYDSLGTVSLQFGDLKAAREYFKKYLTLSEQLAHQDPDSALARRDLSVSYDRLGDVSLQLGDLKAAREYFEKSLNLREQLAHQDPESAQARRDLSVSYSKLGNVSLRGGDLKAAREYFEKYLNLSEQLARQNPENAQTRNDLAASYNCLGNVSLQGGDLKAARNYFEKSLNLIEQLAQQDPGNAQARRDLAVSYNCLGNVSLQGGDLKVAQNYFEKSLNLTEQMARQDPENAQISLELGVSFCKLGQVLRAAKQYPEAEDRFRKGLDQLSRLKARGKLPPAIDKMLTTTKNELSVLPR